MTLVEWIMPAASNLVGPAALSSCDTEMTEGSDLDQSGSPVAKSLCHLLRGIATEPARAPTPLQAVRRLRPFADHTRLELQRTLASSGAIKEYRRGQAHLLHGAVAALCHVARFCVDDSPRSIVPPFAAAAVNPHSRRPSDLAVLFVVSEDLATRRRAYRMVTFVLTGLSDLGFAVHCVSCAPGSAATLADTLPGAPLTTRNVRYIWGRFSLYDDLAAVCRIRQASWRLSLIYKLASRGKPGLCREIGVERFCFLRAVFLPSGFRAVPFRSSCFIAALRVAVVCGRSPLSPSPGFAVVLARHLRSDVSERPTSADIVPSIDQLTLRHSSACKKDGGAALWLCFRAIAPPLWNLSGSGPSSNLRYKLADRWEGSFTDREGR